MAELDVFEARFAAACRRYRDEAPTEVDAAEVARTVVAQSRARRLPWTVTLPAARSLAWVLLLVGLLAALAVGMLAVGSQLGRKVPAVVPPVGELFECPPGSNPDKPGPVDQARPTDERVMQPLLSLAFDRRRGKLVAVTDTSIPETWTFDVCTNTWARMHPNREPPEGVGSLVYDSDSDVTLGISGAGRVWAYDLDANTWTEKGPTPRFIDDVGLLFHDPVSGHVVTLGDDDDEATLGLELWSYEVETDTWTPIPQAEPLVIGPHYEFFAYDASVDRLVAYAYAGKGAEDAYLGRDFVVNTSLFNLRTGAWSGTSAVTPPGFTAGLYGQVPAIAYDEAAQRTVLLGQGHSADYDATADRWETLYEGSTAEDCGTRPECRQMPFMVYDPVNERLLVYGGSVWTDSDQFPHWASPDDVLAFDTRTREWTVLLEPTTGQPALSSE